MDQEHSEKVFFMETSKNVFKDRQKPVKRYNKTESEQVEIYKTAQMPLNGIKRQFRRFHWEKNHTKFNLNVSAYQHFGACQCRKRFVAPGP